uniref:RIB43A domain with coiled-coils 2 n=1 Tax=Scophthalmus maximus TaxID=52904 RepID=A0A8D3EDE5_SCOMX
MFYRIFNINSRGRSRRGGHSRPSIQPVTSRHVTSKTAEGDDIQRKLTRRWFLSNQCVWNFPFPQRKTAAKGRGVKMMNSELPSERVARASLQRRRNTEAERRGRIFNDKVRTIGLDLEGLDTQVKQRKRLEEAEEEKQKACDAEMLHNSKVACILHNREVKKRRATETAIANFRHQYQQPCSQRDFDLNDPDRFKKTSVEDAQMMPPGLVGEDPESKNRLLRQREQLREWLVEQQGEQAADRRQRMLEGKGFVSSHTVTVPTHENTELTFTLPTGLQSSAPNESELRWTTWLSTCRASRWRGGGQKPSPPRSSIWPRLKRSAAGSRNVMPTTAQTPQTNS